MMPQFWFRIDAYEYETATVVGALPDGNPEPVLWHGHSSTFWLDLQKLDFLYIYMALWLPHFNFTLAPSKLVRTWFENYYYLIN